MKKRYLPKPEKPKDLVSGAYDKSGKWWSENDIQIFTGGVIRMCFGKERKHIKIIEIEKKDITFDKGCIKF